MMGKRYEGFVRCWQVVLIDLNGSYIVGNLFICNTDSFVLCTSLCILFYN